jgi:hypothetical protein
LEVPDWNARVSLCRFAAEVSSTRLSEEPPANTASELSVIEERNTTHFIVQPSKRWNCVETQRESPVVIATPSLSVDQNTSYNQMTISRENSAVFGQRCADNERIPTTDIHLVDQ